MKVYDLSAPTPQGPAAADEQAFLLGVEFHEAAVRAGVEARDPGGAPVMPVVPMIVAYAFAAELYLKALASTGTAKSAIQGHKLHVLFGRLAPAVQAEIASGYTAKTGRSAKLLADDLFQFTNAFVDWRYVFEGAGQQVRINLLIAFVQSVYATARKQHETWSVRDDQDQRLRAPPSTLHMTLKNVGGGTFIHIVDGTPGGQLSTPEA